MTARALLMSLLVTLGAPWSGCATDAADDGGADDAGRDPSSDGGPAVRDDAGHVGFDGGPPPEGCDEAPPLEVGRCRDASGDPVCDGSEHQEPTFEPMPPDASIAMVVGPQGATMFVMATRTTGIVPGDPSASYSTDNPLVEIRLTSEEGELLSLYRGRSAFREDPAAPDTYFNASLFVVVDERGGALLGQTVHAQAVLRDADGQVRCGSLSFVAGGP